MPSTKTKRKRKRKLKKERLIILGVLAALFIGLVGFGTHKAVAYFNNHRLAKEEMEMRAEKYNETTLASLAGRVDSAFVMNRLEPLSTEISDYFFNNQLSDLKDRILAYISDHNLDPAKISWAVQDLTTNAYIESDNARTNFVAASTYKLPLAMLWYEKLANGEANMDDTYLFTEDMKEVEDLEDPQQPIHLKYQVGDRIPLKEILECALQYSDNIAGHMLFEYYGGWSAYRQAITKYSDAVQDQDFLKSNVFNVDYMMDLLYHLYHTQGTYDEAKYWLELAIPNWYFNSNYPYGYLQKIGNNGPVRNSAGFIEGDFPFSLAVYTNLGIEDGDQALADIGQICYEYFQERYYSGFYENYPVYDKYEVMNRTYTEPLTNWVRTTPSPHQEDQSLPFDYDTAVNKAIIENEKLRKKQEEEEQKKKEEEERKKQEEEAKKDQ